MYDIGICKIDTIWYQSNLGDLKIFDSGCIVASDSDWNVFSWIYLHSISSFNGVGNCFIYGF